MSYDLHCAICGEWCGPDSDHVEIEAEHVRMKDRNDVDEFAMHTDCWNRLSEGWVEPV